MYFLHLIIILTRVIIIEAAKEYLCYFNAIIIFFQVKYCLRLVIIMEGAEITEEFLVKKAIMFTTIIINIRLSLVVTVITTIMLKAMAFVITAIIRLFIIFIAIKVITIKVVLMSPIIIIIEAIIIWFN